MSTLLAQSAYAHAEEADLLLDEHEQALRQLEQAFGQSFCVLDAKQRRVHREPEDWLPVDLDHLSLLLDQIALHGLPASLNDYEPVLFLGIPLPQKDDSSQLVALAPVLMAPISSVEAVESVAYALGVDPDRLFEWSLNRPVWPAEGAHRLLEVQHENWAYQKKTHDQQEQLSDLTGNLIATFDELNMLHRLTGRVTLRQSARELCDQAIRWLHEVIPAECVLARWEWTNNKATLSAIADEQSRETKMLSYCYGAQPVPETELDAFFESLGPEAKLRSTTINRDQTQFPSWAYPTVTEVVTAPILANERILGWIAAFNYKAARASHEGEFGIAESSLLSSVASILGVHAGNRRLYRLQTELFNGAIRAMIAAIDAKDHYTRGHSDRVAMLSVRLAQQLGLSEEEIDTIYLGGLLHDIGKIGISDQILSKPDKLTAEEFEEIKTHPARGEEILTGVPQLTHVLPIVLHHHEAWDGGGYPGGLVGIECPKLARIVAVADAADAMGSDRVYRKGMPQEKVEAILQDGAGKQWDPDVVDAYMQVREELAAIQNCQVEIENDAYRRPEAASPLSWSI